MEVLRDGINGYVNWFGFPSDDPIVRVGGLTVHQRRVDMIIFSDDHIDVVVEACPGRHDTVVLDRDQKSHEEITKRGFSGRSIKVSYVVHGCKWIVFPDRVSYCNKLGPTSLTLAFRDGYSHTFQFDDEDWLGLFHGQIVGFMRRQG
jgi:hypothetical protein